MLLSRIRLAVAKEPIMFVSGKLSTGKMENGKFVGI